MTFSSLKLLGPLKALGDDITEHFFDFINGELLSELLRRPISVIVYELKNFTDLRNIDFLNFQVVQDVSERL